MLLFRSQPLSTNSKKIVFKFSIYSFFHIYKKVGIPTIYTFFNFNFLGKQKKKIKHFLFHSLYTIHTQKIQHKQSQNEYMYITKKKCLYIPLKKLTTQLFHRQNQSHPHPSNQPPIRKPKKPSVFFFVVQIFFTLLSLTLPPSPPRITTIQPTPSSSFANISLYGILNI